MEGVGTAETAVPSWINPEVLPTTRSFGSFGSVE